MIPGVCVTAPANEWASSAISIPARSSQPVAEGTRSRSNTIPDGDNIQDLSYPRALSDDEQKSPRRNTMGLAKKMRPLATKTANVARPRETSS